MPCSLYPDGMNKASYTSFLVMLYISISTGGLLCQDILGDARKGGGVIPMSTVTLPIDHDGGEAGAAWHR